MYSAFPIQQSTGYMDGAVYLYGREATSGKAAAAAEGSASVAWAGGGLGWSTWSQMQLLFPQGDFYGSCENCRFGYSVGLQGDWLAGGAYGEWGSRLASEWPGEWLAGGGYGEWTSWGVSACKPTGE